MGNNRRRGRPAKPTPETAVIKPGATYQDVQTVKPDSELVARSNVTGWWTNYLHYLHRLPRAHDDLSVEMGSDVIRRMMNDSQISSSVYTLVLQALARGLRAKPRWPRGHEMYKPGVAMYDFISYCLDFASDNMLDTLELNLSQVLEDMMVASLCYGNSVAEFTTHLQVGGPLDGKMVMGSLKPKPPEVYGYIVDKIGNVPALAVFTGNYNPQIGYAGGVQTYVPSVITTALSTVEFPADQLEPGWELLPIGKFAVMTHHRTANDPRGNSGLRAAYNPWYIQMQIWPEYLKYLTQFASPSIDVMLPEKPYGERLPNGQIKPPDLVMAEALAEFQNGGYIVRRFGSELNMLWSQGEGTAFTQAINVLNHEKVKAILHSILGTDTAHNQTRAASSTHKDVQDLPARGVKFNACMMMQMQIFKRLIYYNFGPAAAQYLTPIASLGDMAPEDKAAIVASYSLAGLQILPSQYAGIADEIELDPPTDAEVALLGKTMEQAAAPPPAPAGSAKPAKKAAARASAQETDRLMTMNDALESENIEQAQSLRIEHSKNLILQQRLDAAENEVKRQRHK